MNKRGPRIEPCGTPVFISFNCDNSPSNSTYCFVFDK